MWAGMLGMVALVFFGVGGMEGQSFQKNDLRRREQPAAKMDTAPAYAPDAAGDLGQGSEQQRISNPQTPGGNADRLPEACGGKPETENQGAETDACTDGEKQLFFP